ncbi:hypothetical protein [Nonomuraea insulae]|uniref:Uncharacterized protein n=1 Tax=Nonomuraea insulae TaxID=1616787 RepID=A0ABW1CZ02_9ACTN
MRVLLSTYGSRENVERLVGRSEARACAPPDEDFAQRATAVAGMIRADGTTVAAKPLLDTISRERPPVPA